ncbi:hypothetical protein C3V43_10475 [Bacteroides heparinolyticus]|nr:hypothetical protein [Bacteroides heparinolyticus]AVM58129.1 hypothetical protein C3V43_10475 [Bacteroides heparinolyticus]
MVMKTKCKKHFFLLFILLLSIHVYAQTDSAKSNIYNIPSKTELYIGKTYRYIVNYYGSDESGDHRVVITSNVHDPFEGIKNEIEWQFFYRIDNKHEISRYLKQALYIYLKPYLKKDVLEHINDDTFLMWLDFDLNGILKCANFAFPADLNISMEAIENLDIALRKGCKLQLTNEHPDGGRVKYIEKYTMGYSLKDDIFPLKKENSLGEMKNIK